MKKLLIATHNPAKLKEIPKGLQSLVDKGVEIVSLADLHITDEPEEAGQTFEENGKLKAEYYANLTQLPALSDDGGLEIDILNGEPGVISKRWPGYAASDQELIEYTFEKLKNVPHEKRGAQFKTCLYFYDPLSKTGIYEVETVRGKLSDKVSKNPIPGFPYRSLFIVDEFDKYYDELTHEEHEQINHRFKALKRLSEKIEEYLLQ